ncbi:bifunctional 4-hydroxy-2-oxoglutarate aldolase/2-dehydro-3-deoxy-phosphogluconate aldolase [Lachnospiraceae bacterium 62-35]
MNNKKMAAAVSEHKITAILRGIEPKKIPLVAQALYDGGIRLLEITFNQKSEAKLEDTVKAIRNVKGVYGERMYIGAGTVMSIEELYAAKEAGAGFILSPNVDQEVIGKAVKENICAIPGAMTPTEIADAFMAGAGLVKVFPAGNLGITYCRAVMAPLNHIPMIAVGAIDDKNLKEFLKAGFVGVGIGSSLTDKAMIEKEDYDGLRKLAAKYIQAAQ